MVGRVPCGICNQPTSSPNNFLLVCGCGIACHHRCLDPPVPHSSLLAMIDAFNQGMHERSIRSWRCATCMGTKRVNPFLPISAQLPERGGKVARHVPTNKIQASQRGTKHLVDGRESGLHDRVPAVQIPSGHIAQTGTSAAAWPPVRQKRKIYTPTVLKESPGQSTDAKVKVAPNGAPSVRLPLKTTRSPRRKSSLDHWHPSYLLQTAGTSARNDGGVQDVFKDTLHVSRDDAMSLNATPLSFPHSANDPHNFPASSTIYQQRRIRSYSQGGDPVSHPIPIPIPDQEANLTPCAPSALIRRPPLIDFCKVVKRKPRAVLRKTSIIDSGTELNVTGSSRIGTVSRQDSAAEEPPYKRRRLEVGVDRKHDLQMTSEQLNMAIPTQNDIVVPAEGIREMSLDIVLPLDAQNNEYPHNSRPNNGTMADVQHCRSTMISLEQFNLSGTETIHPGVDQQSGYETKQIPQLASPATSHSLVDEPSRHVSLDTTAKPAFPPAAIMSPPRALFPNHAQLSCESHVLPPTLMTPRSLSPPRQSVTKNLLENVVAGIQYRDQLLPSKPLDREVRVPRLARWFKDVGPRLATTSTREKPRRRKKFNAKAVMTGVNEGWTLVGAQIWMTR